MDAIKQWLNDTFYRTVTITETHDGYTTERYSYSGSVQTVQLPYEETITTSKEVIAWDSVASFVLVVLVFVTVTTFLRKAVFGR